MGRSEPSMQRSAPKVSVKDTGIGISRDNIEKLFTDFSQADASTSTKYGGTGLGLAIVKHIVERHRGRLDIASEQGKGTRVTVQLPAAA